MLFNDWSQFQESDLRKKDPSSDCYTIKFKMNAERKEKKKKKEVRFHNVIQRLVSISRIWSKEKGSIFRLLYHYFQNECWAQRVMNFKRERRGAVHFPNIRCSEKASTHSRLSREPKQKRRWPQGQSLVKSKFIYFYRISKLSGPV